MIARTPAPAPSPLLVALVSAGLVLGAAGCAANPADDRAAIEEPAEDGTAGETRASALTESLNRLSPVGDEGQDVPLFGRPLPWEPPKGWDVPPMPEDEGRGLPVRTFGCVSGCCSVHYVKVFDPARNRAILVPVTICN